MRGQHWWRWHRPPAYRNSTCPECTWEWAVGEITMVTRVVGKCSLANDGRRLLLVGPSERFSQLAISSARLGWRKSSLDSNVLSAWNPGRTPRHGRRLRSAGFALRGNVGPHGV